MCQQYVGFILMLTFSASVIGLFSLLRTTCTGAQKGLPTDGGKGRVIEMSGGGPGFYR